MPLRLFLRAGSAPAIRRLRLTAAGVAFAALLAAAGFASAQPVAAGSSPDRDAGDGVPPAAAPSPVEAAYGERAGMPLGLVGYDLFDVGPGRPAPPPPAGRIPDDHRLGPGDGLTVVLDGDLAGVYPVTVDSAGTVALPGLGVLPAADLTVAAFREAIRAEASARLVRTRVHAAVTDLRRIGVLVAGAVRQPGRHAVTARTGLLAALVAAGGIDRTGSLRRLRLIRDGESQTVDAFALVEGTGDEPRLRDGDRIMVPPLGPTAAVAGSVMRPGIFELPAPDGTGSPQAAPPVVRTLLALAGGPLPGGHRITLWRFDPNGRESVRAIGPADFDLAIRPGDLLRVEQRPAGVPAAVTLEGHVDAPGRLPLAEALSLHAVLGDGAGLRPDAYRLFAAVETTDRETGGRAFRAFSPAAVMDGRADRPLMPDDRVVILSADDVAYLGSAGVVAALSGAAPRADERAACPGLAALDLAVRAGRGPPAGAMLDAAGRLPPRPQACPAVFRRHPDLLVLALSQAVLVGDGAARPGLYPVAGPVPVSALAALAGTAGGPASDARALTADGGAVARPGDVVAVETPTVRLTGAVRIPGRRTLTPGLGLADLLADGAMAHRDVYPLIAVVDRPLAGALQVERRAVSPAAVLAGADLRLADGDAIHLFSRSEIARLASESGPPAAAPDAAPTPRFDAGPDGRPAVASARRAGDAAAPEPGIDPAMAAFLDGHAVTVTGAVARPGRWPTAGPTTVAALLDVAGGLLPGARTADAEATVVGDTGSASSAVRRLRIDLEARAPARIVLRPGDALHIPPRRDPMAGRSVQVAGAVRHPGRYTLVEGDRLSSLIARAGGLAADAYPMGAVFTRRAAAEEERAFYRQRATAIRRALAEAMAGDRPPDGAGVAAAQSLIEELEQAAPTGRLQVEADPERLRADPALDIVLQDGDRLAIPYRPLTVRVAGEVLAPAAVQFRDGRDVGDYLRAAGGLSPAADAGRVFVVLPDGRATPVRPSPWHHAPLPIPPGSAIVVPRDPRPFHFLDFAGGLAELLGNLALGAAAVTGLAD